MFYFISCRGHGFSYYEFHQGYQSISRTNRSKYIRKEQVDEIFVIFSKMLQVVVRRFYTRDLNCKRRFHGSDGQLTYLKSNKLRKTFLWKSEIHINFSLKYFKVLLELFILFSKHLIFTKNFWHVSLVFRLLGLPLLDFTNMCVVTINDYQPFSL